MLPPGTDEHDWKELALVPGRKASVILNQPVQWIRTAVPRFFGVALYRPLGVPIRVTTPERTLIDGLQRPDLCGGMEYSTGHDQLGAPRKCCRAVGSASAAPTSRLPSRGVGARSSIARSVASVVATWWLQQASGLGSL